MRLFRKRGDFSRKERAPGQKREENRVYCSEGKEDCDRPRRGISQKQGDVYKNGGGEEDQLPSSQRRSLPRGKGLFSGKKREQKLHLFLRGSRKTRVTRKGNEEVATLASLEGARKGPEKRPRQRGRGGIGYCFEKKR